MVGPVFFDTSIFVAGLLDVGSAANHARRCLSAAAEGEIPSPLTAWHCCLEFYSVATRLPLEYRLTCEDAAAIVEAVLLDQYQVLQLCEASRNHFVTRAVAARCFGGRTYDLHLAEVAHAAGAEIILTENVRHFRELALDTQVMTAMEVAAELG